MSQSTHKTMPPLARGASHVNYACNSSTVLSATLLLFYRNSSSYWHFRKLRNAGPLDNFVFLFCSDFPHDPLLRQNWQILQLSPAGLLEELCVGWLENVTRLIHDPENCSFRSDVGTIQCREENEVKIGNWSQGFVFFYMLGLLTLIFWNLKR